jgi:hypothetical protein
MSEVEVEEPEVLCHCGQPLHYTDEVVEAFTKDLIRNLGPTVKVNVGGRIWEVQRHYIALHGLKAAELPELGFPEVEVPEDSPVSQEGLGLAPDEVLEPAPGSLEGDESDEALLMYQAASEALRPRSDASDTTPRSPMRSVLPQGERAEGFRAVGQSPYSDINTVLPMDKHARPLPEGCDSYEEAQRIGDEMLNTEVWTEYQVEKFFYRRKV